MKFVPVLGSFYGQLAGAIPGFAIWYRGLLDDYFRRIDMAARALAQGGAVDERRIKMSSVATASSAPPSGVIAVDDLLAPIQGANPAGESLQYAGLHDEIRSARRADEAFEQGDWKHELKVADWSRVVSLATDALTNRTKDLQVCAWLAEALLKLHGLPGLRDGLYVMRLLHEQFWENVYPEIDEGDLEARANSLAWMDQQLAMALKDVTITKSTSGADYSFLDWQNSKDFDIPENIDQLTGAELERAETLKARAKEE